MDTTQTIREYLEGVRGRELAATPGKWEAHGSAVRHEYGLFYWSLSEVVSEEHNATFIAHSRTDVPTLLAMLDVALDGLDFVLRDETCDRYHVNPVYKMLKDIAAIARGEAQG